MTLQTLNDGRALPLMMVVGDFAIRPATLHLVSLENTIAVDYTDLVNSLQNIRPDIVVSKLISGTFDALDVAKSLEQQNYTGMYRIASEPVPNTGKILSEISEVAPNLDVDFILLDFN